jgi:GxxExxY protein
MDYFENTIENDIDNDIENGLESKINYQTPQVIPSIQQTNLVDFIINSANEVFSTLGKGFVESIYHKALLVDLYKTNYTIETKKIIPINYKNTNVGYVESDIIVYDNNTTVIIELKAQDKDLNTKEIIQVQKYMRNITQQNNIGLVINFPQKNNVTNIVQTKIVYLLD